MSDRLIPPPISSTGSFERILSVSAGLSEEHVRIPHEVIRNEFDEPLALHIPGLIAPDEAYSFALAARSAESKDRPTIPGNIGMPVSRLTGAPYPRAVEAVVNSVILSLRRGDEITFGLGLDGAEQYDGDTYPHYDYANFGDIALQGGRLTSNVHLTLSGRGMVQFGQIRDSERVMDLRDGITEAFQNGMTDRDINCNFTTAWIAEENDPRLPDSFKRGIAHIEQALEHPSPPVMLYPGDVVIFEGSMQGDCLPVVHDFRTIQSPDATQHERTFILFRPQIVPQTEELARSAAHLYDGTDPPKDIVRKRLEMLTMQNRSNLTAG